MCAVLRGLTGMGCRQRLQRRWQVVGLGQGHVRPYTRRIPHGMVYHTGSLMSPLRVAHACVHACIHTHTPTHAHTHTRMHTHARTRVQLPVKGHDYTRAAKVRQSYTLPPLCVCVCACACACACARVCLRVCACVRACVCAHARECICVCVCECVRVCMCAVCVSVRVCV